MTTSDEEEPSSLESLLEAARRESPPPELGERLLDQLAYRTRLQNIARPPRRQPLRIAAWSAAPLAAGVLLFFVVRNPATEPIAAERIASSGAQALPAGSAPLLPAGSASAAHHSASPISDPCLGGPVAAGNEPLIDDFEDGDDAIRPLEGRVGFWRWAREIDAPGSAPALIPVPRPDATHSNRFAQHVKGGQLVDWGATVEFDFRPSCYDASKYVGLSFQARGPGRIYIAPRERSVIPIAEGGSCESDCHNPHVTKVDLEPAWHTYQVRWTELRQRGAGKPPLDPRHLHSIAFLIRPEDTPYDVWIDELRFLPR